MGHHTALTPVHQLGRMDCEALLFRHKPWVQRQMCTVLPMYSIQIFRVQYFPENFFWPWKSLAQAHKQIKWILLFIIWLNPGRPHCKGTPSIWEIHLSTGWKSARAACGQMLLTALRLAADSLYGTEPQKCMRCPGLRCQRGQELQIDSNRNVDAAIVKRIFFIWSFELKFKQHQNTKNTSQGPFTKRHMQVCDSTLDSSGNKKFETEQSCLCKLTPTRVGWQEDWTLPY